jgi:hypothetical protein
VLLEKLIVPQLVKKLPLIKKPCSQQPASVIFFLILIYEAIGTAATPWSIVPASGDSEDDCGEADGM